MNTLGAHPASATPARRPGSVRRTTTHDSLRPDGLLGPVTVVARGRDLRTALDGASTILGTARLDLQVDHPERLVRRITGDPSHPGLAALVGMAASAGFRKAVDDAMPGERVSRSVRFQLLDDLPTALLVGGYAVQVGGAVRSRPKLTLQHPDLCAGWVAGGTLVSGFAGTGMPPTHTGPEAPSVESTDDPLGWHAFDSLPPHGMRRRRRLDVWKDGEVALVECFFRDSHMDGDGVETIVHEYTVHATFDPSTRQFLSGEADIGALPWPECPNAAASAARLAGAPAEGLRGWVRDTFVGPSTCTHLNDTLRSLEDVSALVERVDEGEKPTVR
ncbi:conserved hypothetical protein [Parafrankia sp. EAN1pec]|uniref:DUF2889 domain-containing protein n=1 Tax=Parafrankia sp. (strain EAN1pec) TaxID=298653 RepID=UPI0000543083|nr:conserved hypothetical protein [Frankia sp. EAN1pec]